MKSKLLPLLITASLLGLGGASSAQQAPPAPANGTESPASIYASPIHGGCYIAGPNQCRFHFDPFVINISPTNKLVFFQLVAINGSVQTVIYDFHTDVSNPPTGNYTPSLVAQDFAARCGLTYQVNLQGRDNGSANAYSLGLTGSFVCPSSVP